MRNQLFLTILFIFIACDVNNEQNYISIGQDLYDGYQHLYNHKILRVIKIEDIPEIKEVDLSSAEDFEVDTNWTLEEAILNVTTINEANKYLNQLYDEIRPEETNYQDATSDSLKQSIDKKIYKSDFNYSLSIFSLLSDNKKYEPIYLVISVKDKKNIGARNVLVFELVYSQETYYSHFNTFEYYPSNYNSIIEFYLELKEIYLQKTNIEFLGFDIINIKDNCPNYITEPCDLRQFETPITYKL